MPTTPLAPPSWAGGNIADNANWNGQGSSLVDTRTGQPLSPAQLAALNALPPGMSAPPAVQVQAPSVQDQINQILSALTNSIAPAKVDFGSLLAPYDQASQAASAAGAAGIKAITADQQSTAAHLGDLMNQYAKVLADAHSQLGIQNQQSASNLNSALAPLVAALHLQGADNASGSASPSYNPLAAEASMLRGQQAANASRSSNLLDLTGANENAALTNDKAATASQAQSALGLLQSNLSSDLQKIGLARAQAQSQGTALQQQYNDAAARNASSVLSQANKYLADNAMQTGRQAVQQQMADAVQNGGHDWAVKYTQTILNGAPKYDGATAPHPGDTNPTANGYVPGKGYKVPDIFSGPAKTAAQALQRLEYAGQQGWLPQGLDTQLVQNWITGWFDNSKSLRLDAPSLLAQFINTLAP